MSTEHTALPTPGYPGEAYQRLFNAISGTNGIALLDEMNEIIRIVHEDFPPESPSEWKWTDNDMKEAFIAGVKWDRDEVLSFETWLTGYKSQKASPLL